MSDSTAELDYGAHRTTMRSVHKTGGHRANGPAPTTEV